MTGKRVPLQHVPNAANSPLRQRAGQTFKRARAHEDDGKVGSPPQKKRTLLPGDKHPKTPTSKRHGELTERAVSHALKPKAEEDRDNEENQHTDATFDHLRKWQRHYKKLWPTFVFFFDAVQEDQKRLLSRKISHFGAREDKFFSRDVTHVITTRAAPSIEDASNSQPPKQGNRRGLESETINPSALSKPGPVHSDLRSQNGLLLGRRQGDVRPAGRDVAAAAENARRTQTSTLDILVRAREMGMKVWSAEKITRILYFMSEEKYSTATPPKANALDRPVLSATKNPRNIDLKQLLQEDQAAASGDREVAATSNEQVPLKSPYVYVYCMNEKTKPILLREYPEVADKEDGEWPQFRSTAQGRCPFVDERHRLKQTAAAAEVANAQAPEDAAAPNDAAHAIHKQAQAIRQTRAATAQAEMPPPGQHARRRPMIEIENNLQPAAQRAQPNLPTPVDGLYAKPNDALTRSFPFPLGAYAKLPGGEPFASGMQQSNITSAIRSQMISSTAAQPGAKAGTSKEIHGLQRKVLERNSGPSIQELQRTGRTGVMAHAQPVVRAPVPTRAAKARAQQQLGRREPPKIYEDDPHGSRSATVVKTQAQSKNRAEEKAGEGQTEEQKEGKPGYCENCREKFDDFDTHISGKRHRRFATNNANFEELDALLAKLVRPRKHASPASDDLVSEEPETPPPAYRP